jgi:hypothetical protein
MSPEPKKPIEELLEASAKARRTEFGADPKMPNPMRARLHEEIARLGQKPEPGTRSGWLTMSWPRLAIGAALAALVIGASVMWWHGPQSTGQGFSLATHETGAVNETNQTEPEFDKVLREGGQATSPPAGFADASSAETKSVAAAKIGEENSDALKKFAEIAITPAAPAPVAQGSGADEKNSAEVEARLLAEERARVASGMKKVAPESSRPVAAAALAPSRKMEAANFRQQFSQNAASQAFRANAKVKQAVNVLNTFQVEQDGLQIRVVDADGSTYTGKIEQLAPNDSRNLFQKKQSYAAQSEGAAANRAAKEAESVNNEFYFRATGYNRGLKKSLVLEANYIPTPSQQNTPRDAAAPEGGEQTPARIVGTAKIHGESPIQVDAVSTAP